MFTLPVKTYSTLAAAVKARKEANKGVFALRKMPGELVGCWRVK